MSAPLIAQGTLNRLRGSVVFAEAQDLNITAPFLGPEGINLTPEGEISDTLPTMTGSVPSPVPYQFMTVEVELLKTQTFSDRFKRRIEVNSFVGPMVVRPDAKTLSNYLIFNASIVAAGPGRLNGTSAAFVVAIRGYYLINASLYANI